MWDLHKKHPLCKRVGTQSSLEMAGAHGNSGDLGLLLLGEGLRDRPRSFCFTGMKHLHMATATNFWKCSAAGEISADECAMTNAPCLAKQQESLSYEGLKFLPPRHSMGYKVAIYDWEFTKAMDWFSPCGFAPLCC